MTTFRITLAYDGTDFVGWQRQATGTSVQGLLEEALRALDGRAVAVAGAGRTDAGVHALAQVAAFTLERSLQPDGVVRALNARLPDAVRVLAADEVPCSFNPRFDACAKTYRYRIWNGEVVSPFERRYAWHMPGPLDVETMRQAARVIEGTHDFAAFQSAGTDVTTTVRRIVASRIADCGFSPASPHSTIGTQSAIRNPQPAMLLCYEITGTGFLRHMVRAIVGSLVEIGRGRRPVDWLTQVLESRDRAKAGPTAPPHGLFLVGVEYRTTGRTDTNGEHENP
jgi:tRNA pseudouridine38-40 synthase